MLTNARVLMVVVALIFATLGTVFYVHWHGTDTTVVGAGAPPPTIVKTFTPFGYGGNLASDLVVEGTISGSCWEGSLANPRSDAWRCIDEATGSILDPCFAPPSGSGPGPLACINDPLSGKVVLMRVESLPYEYANPDGDPTRGTPSVLKLEGGAVCTFVTGATAVVAGQRANYACLDGGWIVGDPDRTSSRWTASVYRPGQSSSLARVPIRVVWF